LADDIAFRLQKALALHPPTLHYIAEDNRLSKLGDAVINYIASVSESVRLGIPTGLRVDNEILMKAVRDSGLRVRLSHRRDRHTLGDAAEALIAYAWIMGSVTMGEYVETMLRGGTLQDGMTLVLGLAIDRAGVMKDDIHNDQGS